MQIFNNRKFWLLFIIIFLLITWVMFVTSQERKEESKVEYFLNTAIAPLENIFSYSCKTVNESWRTVSGLARLKVENEKLQAELKHLKTRQLTYTNLENENQRLRDALRFEQNQIHKLMSAEIISVSTNNWSYTFTINRGRKDGIKKGMAVISPQGVVGRIGEVRYGNAEVILVSDSREGNYIGGVVKRTKCMVIVSGGGKSLGQCSIRPAVDSYFFDLKKNDLIITGDTSERFPGGIPIGRVVSVNKGNNNMAYRANLEPTVNLSKLQFVYVVKMMKRLPRPISQKAIQQMIATPASQVMAAPAQTPTPGASETSVSVTVNSAPGQERTTGPGGQ
jgi:rod shape-determining protein MreC